MPDALRWLLAPPSERRLLVGRTPPRPDDLRHRHHDLCDDDGGGRGAGAGEHGRARRPRDRAAAMPSSCPRPKACRAVLAAARSARGTANVLAVPESEMRATLERWLGPAGLGGDMPLPALVTFDLAAGANGPAIAQRIERAAPGARVVAHEATLAAAAALAPGAAMAGAGAGGADGRGDCCRRRARGAWRARHAPLHDRSDARHRRHRCQVTRLFQRKIALDALTGALAGAAAAALVLLVLAGGGAAARWSSPRGRAACDGRPASCWLCCRLPPCCSRPGLPAWPCSRHCGGRYDRRAFSPSCCSLYALGFILFAVTLGKPAAGESGAHRRGGGDHRRPRPDRAWRRGARRWQAPSGCWSPARTRR